jgi:hypothetical protein
MYVQCSAKSVLLGRSSEIPETWFTIVVQSKFWDRRAAQGKIVAPGPRVICYRVVKEIYASPSLPLPGAASEVFLFFSPFLRVLYFVCFTMKLKDFFLLGARVPTACWCNR